MESALILAATTAVLKTVLENGLIEYGLPSAVGGDMIVSTLPPHRIKVGSDERPQINLFLYQVNAKGLYTNSRYEPKGTAEPAEAFPRALELYYLLTAYVTQDLHSELMLGYAQDQLHRNACLTSEFVRKTLKTLSADDASRIMPAALAALKSESLARRFKTIQITTQSQSPQDMQNLWSIHQSPYRLSCAYKVVVTLQEAAE